MTRIRFEDLPSTNTPRNAENLNKLNNVVISPTEPTTGEEVWFDNTNKKIYIKNDNGGYDEFYDEDSLLDIYTTDERVVGRWIDGRPIYKKVVVYHNSETIGVKNGTTTILIPHEITNLGLVVNNKILNRDNYIVPLTTGDNNGTFQNTTGIYQVSSTNIQLRITNDTWSPTNWFFILKYTKTTD